MREREIERKRERERERESRRRPKERADDYPHRQAAIAQEDIAYESLRRKLTMGQEARTDNRSDSSSRREPTMT